MAKPNQELITAIRRASKRIKEGSDYQWGHMGKCNCGHLAQELTRLSKEEIHQSAMAKSGDWSEQVLDYCPTSGFLMDQLIGIMLEAGLDRTDLICLEKLSSAAILQRIEAARKPLNHNKESDVTLYMNTWADMLEESLLKKIQLPEISERRISDYILNS